MTPARGAWGRGGARSEGVDLDEPRPFRHAPALPMSSRIPNNPAPRQGVPAGRADAAQTAAASSTPTDRPGAPGAAEQRPGSPAGTRPTRSAVLDAAHLG